MLNPPDERPSEEFLTATLAFVAESARRMRAQDAYDAETYRLIVADLQREAARAPQA